MRTDVVEPAAERSSRGLTLSAWVGPALIAALVTVIGSAILLFVGLPGTRPYDETDASGAVEFRSDTDKAWLVAIWIFALIWIALTLVLARRRARVTRPWTTVTVAILSLLSIVFAIVLGSWHEAPFYGQWSGFGWAQYLAFASAAAIILVLSSRLPPSSRTGSRIALVLSCVVVFLVGIWPLLQTPYTFSFPSDNQFTIDELLAPSIGRMPGLDYIAQYENLLGYPLALVALIFPAWFASAPDYFAVSWMVILQVLSLAVAVWSVARAVRPSRRWIVPVTIIPIAFLAGVVGLPYYADLPNRLGLPFALGAVIVAIGVQVMTRGERWWMALVIGLAAGVVVTNNVDFGGPAAVCAIGVVVLTARSFRGVIARGGIAASAALVFPLFYLGIGLLTGRVANIDYQLFFIRTFGTRNYLAIDIVPFGLWALYVFVGIAGIVLGVFGLRRRTGRIRAAHALLLFTSGWMLISLAYFSGRSLLPTLISANTAQLAIVVSLLLIIGLDHLQLLRRRPLRTWPMLDKVAALGVVLTLAVPIGAWTSFPPVDVEQSRLLSAAKTDEINPFLIIDMKPIVAAVPKGTDLKGFIAISNSYWSAHLGVRSVGLFLHPAYLSFPGGPKLQCKYLADLPGTTTLITSEIAGFLSTDKTCQRVLDFEGATILVPAPDVGHQWLLLSDRH